MSFLSSRTARYLLSVRTYDLWRRQLAILSGVQRGHAELLTREYSIFSDFTKSVKGEIERNPELKNGISDLEKAKEKALKQLATSASRLHDSTEPLYQRIGAVRQGAETTFTQLSAAVREKVSEASEKVKDSAHGFRSRAEQASSTGDSEGGPEPGSSRQGGAQAGSVGGLLDGLARGLASVRSLVGGSVRAGAAVESVKQGYQYVRRELAGSVRQRKAARRRMPSVPSASSALTVGVKSGWEKRYEELKERVGRNPVVVRMRKAAQPILGRGQELADEVRDRWETSDSPVVQRLQDWNESVFGETPQALAMKAILARDPLFSLPEFLGEVGEDVRPVLLAYLRGDAAVLRAKCRPQVVERCLAEKAALAGQGVVVENKVLHIGDPEVVQLKMLASDPLIILRFQTHQLFCVRDARGGVMEGGADSIMTFFYLWAMQLSAPEDCPPGTLYEPTWQLREVQQLGMQTLI